MGRDLIPAHLLHKHPIYEIGGLEGMFVYKEKTILILGILILLTFSLISLSNAQEIEKKVDLDITEVCIFNDGTFLISSSDGLLQAFDSKGELLWSFKVDNAISSFSFSPDEDYIAIGSDNQKVYLLDKRGNLIWDFDVGEAVTAVDIISEYIVIGTWDGKLLMLNREKSLLWEKHIGSRIYSIDTNQENMLLIVGSRDCRIRLFNLSGKELREEILPLTVYHVAVNKDKIIGATDTLIQAYSIDGKVLWNYTSTSKITSIALQEKLIAIGTSEGLIILNDNGSLLKKDEGLKGIMSLKFSPNGKKLILANRSGVISVLDIESMINTRARNFLSYYYYIICGTLLILFIILKNKLLSYSQKFFYNIWQYKTAYLFIIPTITLLIIFSYYPAFSGLYHAFTEWVPGSYTRFTGLENFKRIFQDRYFWKGVNNLIILLITGLAKTLTTPLLVAELIFQLKNNISQYVYRTLFVIPMVVPSMVTILLWRMIYNPSIGLVNQILGSLGLGYLARAWLSEESTALWAIVFMGFPWIGTTAFLIYYAGLINIPSELIDAAKIDGATWFNRFIQVDIPMIMGQIKLLIILTLIGTVQGFQNILVMTGGGPGNATYVPALEMYYAAFREANFGYASAIAFVLFIFILIGTIINMKYVRSFK